ncbi:MAG: hypothetical protein ABIZ09_19995 [Rhodoferax sp.]
MHFRLSSLALVLLLAQGSASAQSKLLVPPGDSLFGASQAEWSIKWWQWAFSFERVRSPISDRTGVMCASRQSGDIWFLAGTYGTARTERTCTVPEGKTLFFPLINYVSFLGENSEENCMLLGGRVAALTNNASALVLVVDGNPFKSLESHRFATTCFSLVPGQPADAVANGYYVALRPLAKGRHVLSFGGLLPNMTQDVTYSITVE